MSLRNESCPAEFPRSGITLTEVVVGLVLLGTLLTGILIAAGRFEKQRARSLKKLTAVEILDHLTEEFFRDGFPETRTRGEIVGRPAWTWLVVQVPQSTRDSELVTLRLTIEETGGANLPLASVEVIVHSSQIGRKTP